MGPESCYIAVQWSVALPQMSWVARVVDVVRVAYFQLRSNNQKSELHLGTPLEVRIQTNQNTFLFHNIFLSLRYVCFSKKWKNEGIGEFKNMRSKERKLDQLTLPLDLFLIYTYLITDFKRTHIFIYLFHMH